MFLPLSVKNNVISKINLMIQKKEILKQCHLMKLIIIKEISFFKVILHANVKLSSCYRERPADLS